MSTGRRKTGLIRLLVFFGCTSYVFGQTPGKAPEPQKRARVQASMASATPPPQVLTVVRRLSGPRLLSALRQSGIPIATANEELLATRLATTNISAGLVLGDDLIAVWAPSGEMESLMMPLPAPAPAVPLNSIGPLPPTVPGAPASPFAPFPVRVNDVTVLTTDGRQVTAQYVGMDQASGVTLFRAKGLKSVPAAEVAEKEIQPGLRVFLLFPLNVEKRRASEPPTRSVKTQLAKREALVVDVSRGDGGRVTSATLSLDGVGPEVVGGVVVTEDGQTVGIVRSVQGSNVRVIPPRQINVAASRMATPRPWLGVRGEPFNSRWFARLEEFGWDRSIALKLAERKKGILLTSVARGTPAEGATLKPGDVLVRLNGFEFNNKEEFSSLLNNTDITEPLSLTVFKLNQIEPITVSLKLKTTIDPVMSTLFAERLSLTGGLKGPLKSYGIDSIPISAKAAAPWMSKGGLLVLAVQPDSPAGSAGIQVQDIIETADDEPIDEAIRVFPGSDTKPVKITIVRNFVRLELQLKRK